MQFRFIFREIIHSRGQAWIFALCVALSLMSIVALNSFRRDIQHSLMDDARKLHGGDIIVRSHHPFTPLFDNELEAVFARSDVTGSRGWEFYSVARAPDKSGSLLSNIKAVDSDYPLYGTVSLRSGGNLKEVLQPGRAVVASTLLERLGLDVGDTILLGRISLEIVDVVTAEPQRPVDFFNFGPRILVSSLDLEKMGLVQQGSRVHFEALIKVDSDTSLGPLTKLLQQKSTPGQEQVLTYATAESRVKRFFDNLLFFLSLISVFTLLLAGIGMQSGLAALLRRKEKSVAILKSIGATGRFLVSHYMVLTLILSLIGCLLGILGGFLFKQSFASLFSGLLPTNITFSFTFVDFAEGIGLGLLVAAFFTFLPLSSILNISPVAIFRHEKWLGVSRTGYYYFLLCGSLLLFGLLVRQLDDFKIGLYFLGGFFLLIVCIGLLAHFFLLVLPQSRRVPLELRQAVRSLFRPGNATRSIMITLASALSVLLTIELVENDLHSTYISSYPQGAPNLFCLDIQKNQKDDFLLLLDENVELFPVVRARLTAINGEKISRERERKRRGDRLSREFNLTYRDTLLGDEQLLDGGQLFGGKPTADNGMVKVSVLDSIAEIGAMGLGDILTFNIQGLVLKAEISSIRSRSKSMLYPFFYFVFPEKYLQAAPQTFFAALHLKNSEISQYSNRIVNQFPNVSTINVSETAAELGRLMVKLSRVIDFFAIFSILAGGLILVSSILATRLARMEEGAYYKVLGGTPRFVLKVFFYENLILAFGSGICAIIVAQTVSWALCGFIFDISHNVNWSASFIALGIAVTLIVTLGLLTSLAIIHRKPVSFLHEC